MKSIVVAPTCSDGAQNGDEAGIDCGGPCKLRCENQGCLLDTECKTKYCNNYGFCQGEQILCMIRPQAN